MLTPDQISTALTNANYARALNVNKDLVLMYGACQPKSWAKNMCFNAIIAGLQYQSNRQDYTSDLTLSLYKKVLSLTGFVGTVPGYDPNAQSSNITIIVQNPAGYLAWDDIYWENLSPTDGIDGNGGRSVYYQPLWVGVNPELQTTGVVMLSYPTDYSLVPSGGFSLSPTGNLPYIYEGSFIRASNFKYTNGAPTPGIRDPIIFPDPSGQPSLSAAYLNATYQYPAFQEGDIITLATANQQYQRQDNNNPSTWNNSPFNYA